MAKSTYSYAIKHVPVESDSDAVLKQTITDIKAKATAAGYLSSDWPITGHGARSQP